MMKYLRILFTCVSMQLSLLCAFAQPANDNCNTATSFGSLPVPGACVGGVQNGAVVTMSNQSTTGATGANPYPYITGCSGGGDMTAPALDTWYSFVATGSMLNVAINGFPNASIGVWAGVDCNNLAAIACGNMPASGNGILNVTSLQIGQTYYIQVSGGTGTATDDNFSISLDNDLGCDDCLRTSTLTAFPLPVNGEYAPGQVVRFCFTISEWEQTNTNWLHGVQITMGPGWTGAITNTSPSPTCQFSAGNWAFYPAGIGVVNGINWGPGFYFDSNTGGPMDGNPGNNYGDNCEGTGLNWQFYFDLTVSASCTPGQNLGVTINTSGDGESGSWTNISCQQDPANTLSAVKAPGPSLTFNSTATTTCSGIALNFPLIANVPATFTWVATDNSNVSGESLTVQNSNTITDVLVNNTTVPQTVVYTVVPTGNPSGCTGPPRTVTVTVNPIPSATVTANGPLCGSGDAVFTITGTPNAIVTYNINGGAVQTITLNNGGTATVTVTGISANTTLNIVSVAMPASVQNGVGIAASGGVYTFNSTGNLSAAGTTASNINAALINNTATQLTVTLQHTVPAGTVLTFSIARNNNAGSVNISDGAATQNFSAGPNLLLQYITFTTTVATNIVTITRVAGGVWVDGVSYTLSTPGCASAVPVNATVTVTPGIVPSFPAILPFCAGSAAPVLPTTSINGITGSWNPATVNNTAGGTYTFTPNSGQCATTATLTTTVTPQTIPTFAAIPAFCSGSTAPVLPATSNNGITGSWNPATVSNTAGGTYTFTPNAGQCATTATLTTTVTPQTIPTFAAIPAFCSGSTAPVLPAISNNGITGTWNPATVSNTAGGTYTFTPNAGQCATATILTTTVNQHSSSTTTAGICPSQLPYSWNGNTYTAGGSYTVQLINAAGCDSVANLVLNVGATATSTTTQALCSSQLPFTWNGQQYNSSGTYTVTLTGSSGCDSIATLVLLINANTTSNTNAAICNTALPYVWNGNNYTASGSYVVHLTNTAGCDSAATLNLIVNNTSASTTNVSICNTALPYVWNGNNYTTAGTYVAHLMNTAGCDSAATLNLIVNNTSASITNVSICNTALPYVWNGNNYTSAGTYVVHLMNTAGCDSAATLNLTVNNTSSSTTNVSICNTALPYVWNGNSYTAAGSYVVHLTNTAGCDSAATLNLIVNNTSSSTTNVSICNTALPYVWNGNNYTAAGTYVVHLTNTAGCDSAATLNLVVNNTSASTTNVSICNTALPYVWNGNNYNTAGSYVVHLINTAGCDSAATLNLVVNNTSASTTNVSICNTALPYVWNGNNYTTAGTYVVHLMNTAGCDSAVTLNLVVNNTSASTTNVSICNTALPYVWNGNNYTAAGTYVVHLMNTAGCDSAATLNLVVNNTSASTTNISICNTALPYVWNGNSYNTAGTYIVHLMNSAGCDSVATLILSVGLQSASLSNVAICASQLPYSWNGQNYIAGGTYTVTLTGSSGCDSLATLQLTVNNPTTSLTNISICSTALPYNWNGNNYNAAGSYIIHLMNTAGCDSAATLNLVVNNTSASTTNLSICNTALPYSWNGNNYTAAGSYTVHLSNAEGCDSAAVLNLIVNATSTSITNTAICNSALPYNWNGNSYTAAGVYTIHLTNAAGCDSAATLNLIVNAVTTSTTNVSICNTALPYSWNGNYYTTAGNYIVHLSNSAGCDSAATLNLVVNNTSASTTNVSICNTALPYWWNGNSYSAPGSYVVHLTNTAGCDSAATLQLMVNNGTSSVTNIGICNTALPYVWNGNNYTAAGSYVVHLTNAAGCDSSATLNLMVNYSTASTSNISICNAALPYNWNGNSYTAAGAYTVHLVNNAGCDSAAVLNLTVNNATGSITNTNVCNTALPYSWNGNSYNAAGSYTVHLTNSVGCDSAAVLNLVVNNATSSTTNVNICNTALPYNWNGNNYSAAGSYTVHFINSTGCDSAAILNLTVNSTSSSITNISVCNTALPYHWNGNNYSTPGTYTIHLTNSAGCDSAAILNLTVRMSSSSNNSSTVCSNSLPVNWNGQMLNSAGTYSATLVNSAGCDSVATLQLIVLAAPAAPNVIATYRYCQFEPAVALQATGSYTIRWYTTPTGSSYTLVSPTPSTSIAGTQTYYASQVNAQCESPRVPVQVIVSPKPVLGADRNREVCFGESANLSNIFNTNGLNAVWTYNNVTVGTVAAVSQPGIYQLIAISAAGCRDTAKVNVTILPKMVANAGPDANAEYNYPYQLQGSGSGNIFSWTPSSVLNNSHIANPYARLINDTRFILEVSNAAGCKAYDTVMIKVYKGPSIYVPTAFSPNGDGLNDIFKATAVGIDKVNYFNIFNRYGQIVWQTTNLANGWNGQYNGKQQNAGNYVWVIQATDRAGKVHNMKGNLILIR